MKERFLSNAPLTEVLFEVHWDLEYISEEKILFDSGFEQAISHFSNACKQNFKEISILKPANIPPSAFINRVTHRFYKVKNQHPLYQMGPGVFTINDNNKNYVWVDFLEMLKNGIKCLRSSYNKELILSKVQLRYIDQVSPYVFGDSDKFDFLKKHMNISAEAYGFVEGTLEDITFEKSFNIGEDSTLNLMISTGVNRETKEDVIEWHTFISNKKRLSWEELTGWVEKAHESCSNTFKKMISNELHEYFSR